MKSLVNFIWGTGTLTRESKLPLPLLWTAISPAESTPRFFVNNSPCLPRYLHWKKHPTLGRLYIHTHTQIKEQGKARENPYLTRHWTGSFVFCASPIKYLEYVTGSQPSRAARYWAPLLLSSQTDSSVCLRSHTFIISPNINLLAHNYYKSSINMSYVHYYLISFMIINYWQSS